MRILEVRDQAAGSDRATPNSRTHFLTQLIRRVCGAWLGSGNLISQLHESLCCRPDILIRMYSQRLYQINQLPSTDIRSPPAATIADAIVAIAQAAPKVGYDLLSWMCHQNKLNVLINPQSRVRGNRMNHQRYATLIVLGLEMLNNRDERRPLLIRNCVVGRHRLMRSEK
jgi:hypothetical protein